MRKRTQKKIAADMIKRLHGRTPSERLLHRLHSVALVLSGASASDAARIFGDAPRTVAYWVTRYTKGGIAGLEEESRPGRPSRLSVAQQKEVTHFVRQALQKSKGMNATTLSKYIYENFGITFTTRQCWRMLKTIREDETPS